VREPKIGAFSWAKLEFPERRKADRRSTDGWIGDRRCGGERRFSETAYLYAVGIADRAVENGVSEEDFIKKLIALSEPHKEQCRKIYREVKNARLSRE
jgi:hypothetical protein